MEHQGPQLVDGSSDAKKHDAAASAVNLPLGRNDLAVRGIHGVNPELAARLVKFGYGQVA